MQEKTVQYHAYILESLTSGQWYYGHTNDLQRRLDEHNHGVTTFTRHRGPWKLVASKAFDTKAEAMACERKMKKARNKVYARSLLTG